MENPLLSMPWLHPPLRAANELRRRAVELGSAPWARRLEIEVAGCPATAWMPVGPTPPRGRPGVLLLHGGGWVEGTRLDFRAVGARLARRGIVAVALDYRLAPRHRWPAPLEDVDRALAEMGRLEVTRAGVWGHSAGGQLALVAALTWPERLCCAVAMGAPADLVDLARRRPEEVRRVMDPGQVAGASPVHLPCAEPPPILLVHGTRDRVCPVDHARRLRERFPARVELVEVADGDHGLRWPPLAAPRARRRAEAWLAARLARP